MTIFRRSRPKRTAGRMSSVPECECDKTLERLPPGINPPSLAACDSMACCQLCRQRQDAASRPTTKQQKDSLLYSRVATGRKTDGDASGSYRLRVRSPLSTGAWRLMMRADLGARTWLTNAAHQGTGAEGGAC